MEVLSAAFILGVLKIVCSTASVLGVLFGVFKVISWIKGKFENIENRVVDLKTSLDTNFTGLREDINKQTHVISSALGEQRQDFRTFIPMLLTQQLTQNQQPQPVPARAKPRARKKTVDKR